MSEVVVATSAPADRITQARRILGGQRRFTALELCVVLFAIWTLAFWLSLTVFLGWVGALTIAVVLTAAAVMGMRRIGVLDSFDQVRARVMGRGREGLAMTSLPALTLAIGLGVSFVSAEAWPWLRWIVALVACAALVSEASRRPAATNSLDATPWVALGAAAVLGAASLAAYATNWWLFVLVVGVSATAAIAFDDRLGLRDRGVVPDRRLDVAVVVLGIVFAWWVAVSRQPNPDDIYYLNKAAHYAQSPWRFRFEDHLYGVEGVRHLSTSDFFSSYEPLLGLLGRLTGASPSFLRAVVIAPATAFAIPVAYRYVAASLRARQPVLVAVVAALPLLLFRVNGDSLLLIDKIAQGKGVAALVLMPVLIGAAFRTIDSGDPRRTIVVVAAAIAIFGLTGSAAIAAVGALAACAIAALALRRSGRSLMAIGSAIGVLFVLGVVGFLLEPHTGFDTGDPAGNAHTADGSWIRRAISYARDQEIEVTAVGFSVIAALVAGFFLASSRRARVGLAALAGVTFVGVYNPIIFEFVIGDVLGLDWLAWRFGWMLPTGLALGFLVDGLASMRGHPAVVGVLAAVVLGVVLVAGEPTMPNARSADHDFSAVWIDAADKIIAATPDGGRYLAPERGELAVSALSPDVHPTYGRRLYLDEVPMWDPPDDFHYWERDQLRLWINGSERASGEPAELLRIVEIDTVCLPDGLVDTELGRAVERSYRPVAVSPRCAIWSRNGA